MSNDYKRTCSHCGTLLDAEDTVCPVCGEKIPDTSLDEIYSIKLHSIDQEKEVYYENYTPPMEKKERGISGGGVSTQTYRPSAGDVSSQHEKANSFLKVYGKVIAVFCVLVLIAATGIYTFSNHSNTEEKTYIKNCVAISERLTKNNDYFMENTQKLSCSKDNSEISKNIVSMKANRQTLQAIAKDYTGYSVPEKFKDDNRGIIDLLNKNIDLYDEAIYVTENPNSDMNKNKVHDIEESLIAMKDMADTIHIAGASFSQKGKLDMLPEYLLEYLKLQRSAPINDKKKETEPKKTQYYTYLNDRYAYTIEIPFRFQKKTESANHDGAIFEYGRDDAKITVFGAHNSSKKSATAILDEMVNKIGSSNIKYKDAGDTWYAVSWTQNGRVNYQKTCISNEYYNSFIISFPSNLVAQYKDDIEYMEAHFIPGWKTGNRIPG